MAKGTEVIVSVDGRREVIKDRELAAAIRESFELYRQTREVGPELATRKDLIARRARGLLGPGGGSVSFRAGQITCRVTARREAVIPEGNVAEVRRLLGRRFAELIKVQTRYVADKGLLDGGHAGLCGLVELKELSPRMSWQYGY